MIFYLFLTPSLAYQMFFIDSCNEKCYPAQSYCFLFISKQASYRQSEALFRVSYCFTSLSFYNLNKYHCGWVFAMKCFAFDLQMMSVTTNNCYFIAL